MKRTLITGVFLLGGIVAFAQSNETRESNTLPAQRTMQVEEPEQPEAPVAPARAPKSETTAPAPPAPPKAPQAPSQIEFEEVRERSTEIRETELSLPEEPVRVSETTRSKK